MTRLNLRPGKPDLTVMKQPKTLLRRQAGKFTVAELEKGRTRELEHLVTFGSFDEMSESPRGHEAYDMVWVVE